MPIKGEHHTEESKRKMSEAHLGEKNYNYGKHLSKETRKKIGLSNTGKHDYWKGKHHTEETKRKIGLASICRPGYWKGKHLSEETRKRMSLSHSYAGSTHWKGKHHTDETRKKMSDAHTGEKNHQYGKPLTEETKKKISEANKGKVRSEETRKKISEGNKGRVVTEETRKKLSERQLGEKNHFYGKHLTKEHKQKISFAERDWDFYNEHGCLKRNYPYNDCFTEEFKDMIRKRDDYKCVVTGMTNKDHLAKYGKSLTVHHWTYDKDETNPFYFATVTCEINNDAESNRGEWIEMFNGIAEDKYCELLK